MSETTYKRDMEAPDTPRDLSVETNGNQATLTWSFASDNPKPPIVSSGVKEYRIFLRKDGQSYGTTPTEVVPSATDAKTYEHTMNGLTSGIYYATLRTVDHAGNISGNSNEVEILIVTEPPITTALTIKPDTWTQNTNPTLSWEMESGSPLGAVQYQITQKSGADVQTIRGWTAFADTHKEGSESIGTAELADGAYTITVRGVNAGGEGVRTESVIYKKDTTAPGKATPRIGGIRPDPEDPLFALVEISWAPATDEHSGVASYNVAGTHGGGTVRHDPGKTEYAFEIRCEQGAKNAVRIITYDNAFNRANGDNVEIDLTMPLNVNLSLPEYRSDVYASTTWSADPGYEADKAVDGDKEEREDPKESRWASSEDGKTDNLATLTVLFDNTYDFNSVVVNAWNEDDRVGSYQLQYLQTGGDPKADSDWVNLGEKGDGSIFVHNTDIEIHFDKKQGDGVRITLEKTTQNFHAISLYEFEVYNRAKHEGMNERDPQANLTGAAYRESVYASTTWTADPGHEADKAVDNDKASHWASSENGSGDPAATLTVLFQDTYNFNHVMINAHNEDDRIGRYQMQYLKKGGNPNVASDWVAFAEGDGGMLIHRTDFEVNRNTLYADGVRITMTKTKPSYHAIAIYEFQVRYQ